VDSAASGAPSGFAPGSVRTGRMWWHGGRAQGLDRVSWTDVISSGVRFIVYKDMCVHIRVPLRALL
jgi:hypothetical protein